MDTADAALWISLITFFLLVALFVRQNRLDEDLHTIRRSHRADEQNQQRQASVSVTHHRNLNDPGGYFLVHNTGKSPADDVQLQIRGYAAAPGSPLIPEDCVHLERMRPGERRTVETTTVRDDEWPVEVLVTWTDNGGPAAELTQVDR